MDVIKIISYGLAGLLFIGMGIAEAIPGVDPPWLLSVIQALTGIVLIFVPKLQDVINPSE